MTTAANCQTLLQLSDLHILADADATLIGVNTRHYFNQVLELAFAEQGSVDSVLLTGDLAQDPVASSYRYIADTLRDYAVQCLCLPGNHDDYPLMQQTLTTENISCNKQTVLANWQIICLNSQIIGSEGGELAAEELNFLESCLQDQPDLYALVAVHHHCLATDSVWMDTMQIANSETFLALIARYPQTKLIVHGHIHQEMDTTVNGVRVLGTPSTCFQFKPRSQHFAVDDAPPAYRVIRLYPDGRVDSEVSRLHERIAELQADTEGY